MALAFGPSLPLSGIITPPVATSQTGTLTTRLVKITGDTSYPTGGTAITAANFGLTTLLDLVILGHGSDSAPTNVPLFAWDSVNSKLMAYGTAVGATGFTQIAAASNLSTAFVWVLVNGII